jgi:hypothetical protein
MTAPVLMKPLAEKIAMTAPVLMQPETPTRHAMSFILPSKYTRVADCPVPTDERVVIKELPSRTWAVRTFSWNMKEQSCRENLALLLADLQVGRIHRTDPYSGPT